jgi:hypothetical protein
MARSIYRRMVEWLFSEEIKGYRWKWLWSVSRYYTGIHPPGGTEGNHKEIQYSRCPSLDWNSILPEYISEALEQVQSIFILAAETWTVFQFWYL